MNYAIILSGGIGTRMKNSGNIPKQYLEVYGIPILVYTLRVFEKSEDIDKIVIVANETWQTSIKQWCINYKIKKFFEFAKPGGTRQESIYEGLKVCEKNSYNNLDKVIIHDSVRPLLSTDLIKRCLEQLNFFEGCMPVLPVKDTIYYSKNGNEINDLLNRDMLYSGQAPEAFLLKKYFHANANTSKIELKQIKGSTELAYKYNFKIKLIHGEEENFKITTLLDLEQFKNIVESKLI